MNKYEATLLQTGTKQLRHFGIVTVTQLAIEFSNNDLNHVIPLHTLQIRNGGRKQQYIYLESQFDETTCIYTEEKNILENEIFQDIPFVKNQIKLISKFKQKIILGLGIFTFLIGLSIASLYYFKEYFVEKVAQHVPYSWEQASGDKMLETLGIDDKIIVNDSINNAFLKIASPLINFVKNTKQPIDVFFIKESSINAYALPGGKIIITSGLVKHANSWEEVLGVLGHELAHISNRHHTKAILGSIGMVPLLQAYNGNINSVAESLLSTPVTWSSRPKNYAYEVEADKTSWDYLVKSKINPLGMISFFATLEKKSLAKFSQDFISMHPNMEERTAVLQQKMNNSMFNFPLIEHDFGQFKRLFKDDF